MIGKRLKELRIESNLSQEELADKFNVSRQSYSSWETDKFEPGLDVINELADFYNVTIDYIFGKTNVRDNTTNDPKLQSYLIKCVEVYNEFIKDH